MAKPTDEMLLDAWRRGDRDAGDRLFDRYFDALFRFFSYKVQGDVEELLQRTFLACVEGRDRFRGDASFRTYLFSVARRQLYSYWRARKSADLDFTVSSIFDLGPSPEHKLADRQERRLLFEALRRLPLELQIAVELHYWENMSGPEIAAILEIPEGTVRSRLRRARESIERTLAQLTDQADVLASTLGDLDRWARSLRDLIKPDR